MSAIAELTGRPAIGPGRVRLASAFYTVANVADLLTMSERQVWRLRDAGLLPAPVRIGRLVRWSRAEIDEWIGKGCPRPESH